MTNINKTDAECRSEGLGEISLSLIDASFVRHVLCHQWLYYKGKGKFVMSEKCCEICKKLDTRIEQLEAETKK